MKGVPIKDGVIFSLRMSRKQRDKLKDIATRAGWQMTEFIRNILDDAIANGVRPSIKKLTRKAVSTKES